MPRLNLTLTGLWKKVTFYLGLVIIWEMVYRTHIWPEYLFPSPLGVLANLKAGFADSSFLVAIGISIKRVLTGYLISLFIGLTLGLLIVRFRYLEETLNPILLGMQTLPSICWLPLAILWFGIGEQSILFVITIGSVFSIAIAIISGIKNVPPLYMRVAKTMGARGIKAYTSVIIPAAMPAIISGMKQGWSFAWRALMAGELLSPRDGLGYALTMGRDLHDMNQVVGVMIIIVVIGLFFEKLVFGQAEANIRQRWGLNG